MIVRSKIGGWTVIVVCFALLLMASATLVIEGADGSLIASGGMSLLGILVGVLMLPKKPE